MITGTTTTIVQTNCAGGISSLQRTVDLRDLSWHRRHNLHEHWHFHNCPDELRRRDCHIHQHRANLRDLSLPHHWRAFGKLGHLVDLHDQRCFHDSVGERHGRNCHSFRHLPLDHIGNNLVDVPDMRDFDVLDHLVDRRDPRHVRNSADERHGRDFHRLCHRLNPRVLSLHQQQRVDKRVDISYLRDLGVLGRLVDRRTVRRWDSKDCRFISAGMSTTVSSTCRFGGIVTATLSMYCVFGNSTFIAAWMTDGSGACRCITTGEEGNLVDVLRLRNLDVLGRLVDLVPVRRPSHRRRSAPPRS